MQPATSLAVKFLCCFFITLCDSSLAIHVSSEQTLRSFSSREYCQWDTFNASCDSQPHHVILMTSARYGRMTAGKCVKKDYGAIGCAVDVLSFADSRCSARSRCTITVADFSLRGIRPCPQDLTSYFEAAYRCVPVESSDELPCSSSRHTKLTSSSGYLASVQPDTITSRFNSASGSGSCKWLIEADAGQHINLTLYDFTSMTSSSSRDRDVTHGVSGSSTFCRRMAVVRDVSTGRETNICSGTERIRHAYISDGSRIEITMATTVNTATNMAADAANAAHFLIRYEVIGCSRADLPRVPGAKVDIATDGRTAVVQCDRGQPDGYVRWSLRCISDKWHGNIGNCTAAAVANEPLEDEMWTAILPQGWSSPYGVVIVVSMGVVFGLIIGASMLGVAVCLLRWKRRSGAGIPRRHHSDDCDDVQYVATGCHMTTATSGTGGKRVGYCDCSTAWPPPQDLVHRTNLIWQTPAEDETSPTVASNNKTIYCRHTTSGCTASTTTPLKSTANTSDLFVDAASDAPARSPSTMADATGRIKTTSHSHLYESPVFSHLDRLLH